MKAKRGQIAIYLVAVILAVTVLVVMNVSIFLAVRSKNRAMNAGDAAALAVARYQGELLNQIGECNIAHLKAALEGDREKCDEIMERQRRICFLDPLDGILIGNAAAKRNGIDRNAGEDMANILREHALEIKTVFANAPELYPEPWEGAWDEYAEKMSLIVGNLGDEMVVGPDNVEFADAWQSFPLLNKLFYEAIAGRNWCWFHFNGEWLFDRDSHNMPRPDFEDPSPRANSEVYSLHLEFRPLPPIEGEMLQIIKKVAECEDYAITNAMSLLTDEGQEWAFFDPMWHRWVEIDPFGENEFPAVGPVKPEYDVRGCAAVCRVLNGFQDLVDDGEGSVSWTAAAKPFGFVEDLQGEPAPVTAFMRFVTPAFDTARLVPIDSVGGMDLSTADVEWVEHIRKHLRAYFSTGPYSTGRDCFYCDQLRSWENPSFRATGKIWLKYHSGECIRPAGPGYGRGGSAHGH